MVVLLVFIVAPFLILSVAWPAWPTVRLFVVQFEPGSCRLTVPLEPLFWPM